MAAGAVELQNIDFCHNLSVNCVIAYTLIPSELLENWRLPLPHLFLLTLREQIPEGVLSSLTVALPALVQFRFVLLLKRVDPSQGLVATLSRLPTWSLSFSGVSECFFKTEPHGVATGYWLAHPHGSVTFELARPPAAEPIEHLTHLL